MAEMGELADAIQKYWQILVFLAGGLVFLAYNHYRTFRILAYILYFCTLLAMITLSSYNYGLAAAYHAVHAIHPPIPVDTSGVVADVIARERVPSVVINALFVFNLFILILYHFPLMGVQKQGRS